MSFSIPLRIGPAARLGGRHRTATTRPASADGERILARAESQTGSIVATEYALLLGDRTGTWRRIAWPAVASTAWSPTDRCLTLRLWPTDDGPQDRVRVAVGERLAAIVRERVEYQRLLCVPVELPPGIKGWVVAVRDADHVRWHVLADAPLDSPALRAACAAAVAEIRSIAGL